MATGPPHRRPCSLPLEAATGAVGRVSQPNGPCRASWTLPRDLGQPAQVATEPGQRTWWPHDFSEGPALPRACVVSLHLRLQAAGRLPSEPGTCFLLQQTDTQYHLGDIENEGEGSGDLPPPAWLPQRGARCWGSGRRGGGCGHTAPELRGVPTPLWKTGLFLTDLLISLYEVQKVNVEGNSRVYLSFSV